ncbi:PAS domain-containing hybrid sensor histidine kinase/response regulator [Pedobacter cryophilus]|uniref:histidine kinase n=1 Tax=Pedobacter cryophilus TaxID=2571271 RepID=A0A4U1C3Y3_9SPHI|nr:PAS domain-containing hybrid sensor histidine kinase/response regulator [Pedobacter cryophilus]TKC00576.1 PAS domain S-box protein [Pedobacter cryophilus]
MNAEEFSILDYHKSNLPVKVEYDYYESSSDIEFDHILELACFITNSPISFISFFEKNLQCVKYTKGIPTSEIPLEQSLCQFTVLENNFFEIEDVPNNAKAKALLKGANYDFKYYAGLPLVSPKGVIIGTICVIDQQSKKLTDSQIKAFYALGLQVINNLELRKKDIQEIKSKLKSEEFTDLFNSSPDLICLLSADQKIVNINSAVFDIMGYDVKDCIGLNISEFMLSEDKMNVFNTATESLRNKIKHFEVETRVVNKNKSIKWISWNAISKNKMWFVTGRDISKYKETLHQLNQLSTVASKINNGVVISSANNNVLWINDAFTKITGYTIEDLEDQKLGDVIVGANSDIDIIEKARIETQNKKSFSVELLAYRKDGKPIWLSIYNTIILDSKGEVESLIEIVIDITERKEAEEQLELLSLVASKTENGVSISDKTGRVKWINAALSKMIGYQLEELIGKRVGDIVKGEETDIKMLNQARDGARKSIPYNLELKVNKKDGTPVWLSVSNTPILDQQGNIEREIEIINDISDRKQAEIQLLAAKEQAMQLSKAKEMFLSVMSHEIRTPLNAVIGITNILLDEEKLEHQVQSLNLLKFSSDNLLNLINDILDFSKMEIGKMELEYKRVNIRDLIKDIVDSLAFKTNEKGIELNYIISPDLPELVRGDKTRLYQILINLINNALKFTEKGFVKVAVAVAKITKQHTFVHFEITDTGIGIPEDKFEDIFESFTQAAANTSRKYGGTGLGLTITKKLVELYSGEIKVKSILGKGSTFYFDLKFDNFKETEMEIKEESNAIKTLNARVLVVDDNEINRILARKVLTKFQVEVVTAESGLKAIELLQAKDFDVVLMDIHMPEMSGYEATEKLRAIDDVYFKELPIIALTASIMNEDLDTIYKYGMNDYQLKPFKPDELIEKIAKYLKK